MSTDPNFATSARAPFARVGRSALVAVLTALLMAGCGDNPDDLVASARKEIEKKEYRAAILQLKTALQKDANHRDARYTLGIALRETGDLPSSEKELRRALELGFDPATARLELARAVYGQGKHEAFVKEFGSEQLPTPEGNAELKAMLGSALFSTGKVQEASQHFDEALKLSPSNTSARLGQARVIGSRGDLAGAEAIISEVLGKAPKDREALSLQVAILFAKGERDRSIEVQRKLVEYYPTEIQHLYALATKLLEAGKVDEAKATVAAMVKLAAADARTAHAQAMLAYQTRDYVAAQDHAVRALSRAPNFLPAQLMAGAASVQTRNFQQAIQYLTSVVQTQRRNLFAQQLLVAAYLGAGEVPRAARTLKDALEMFPNDARLLLLAGEVAARERKVSDATKYFELSAEKGETSGMANLRLGQALLAEGKEAEGLRVLEESTKAGGTQVQSEIALVAHHLRRGEHDKAGKWIDAIEKKSPQSAIAPTLRGVAFLTKRDLGGARKQFEAAVQRDSSAVMALSYLARLDIGENKVADAKRRYEEAMTRHPRNDQLVVDYARLLTTVGEKYDAVAVPLRKYIQDNPTSERARVFLIDLTVANRDRKQAVTLAREALAAIPNSVNLKMRLGRALQADGETNQAISTYTEVLQAQPKAIPAMVAMAQTYVVMKDYPKALESIDRALGIAPDNVELKRLKVLTHVQAKQLDRALAVAREVRQKNPKADIGYELESGVLVAMEKWSDAADLLQVGQREVPSDRMVVRQHAALTLAGNKARAEQVATTWITAHPKDTHVRIYLAESAASTGDHANAVRYYREALTIAPKSALLLNNIAYSADQIKDPKALSYAEEALKIAPNSPAIQDTLGWMLVQKGELARGVDLLEKASKGAPQMLAIRYNYAQALIKAGRKDDARKELDFLKSQGERFAKQAELDKLYQQL